LLAAIVDHRLAPGTRLPEDEIGAVYGVSRTIVRTALQSLAHQRVVTIEPNRGAQVAHPSAAEARHVFEARSLIEPTVAAMAAGRAGARDLARLRGHLKDEHEAVKSGDNSRAIALSADFHVAIAEIAGQPILAGFVRELVSRSSLIVALYWQRKDATCESHAHHALAEAIAAGDGKRASDLMMSHLVDILSGLNLVAAPQRQATLAELLDGRRQT
jgi:DNA-binding GntR family transcriptional regulator